MLTPTKLFALDQTHGEGVTFYIWVMVGQGLNLRTLSLSFSIQLGLRSGTLQIIPQQVVFFYDNLRSMCASKLTPSCRTSGVGDKT